MKSTAGGLLVAAVLMLFGCGGSSGDSALTKAEFVKTLDQMCKKEKVERAKAEEAAQRRLGISPGEHETPAQQAEIVKASVTFYEDVTQQMQALAPPDQEEKIKPVLERREELAKLVRGAAPSEKSLAAIFQANKSAIRYGLKECSI